MSTTQKIKYRIECSPGNYHEYAAYKDYALQQAREWAEDFAHYIVDSRILPCRMPVHPIGSPQFDGRWSTHFNIYSGNKFVHQVTVTEEYYDTRED